MTTFDYNEELIKAMKEKLPRGVNLANTLIDKLYLGKEAVYRRLRGRFQERNECDIRLERHTLYRSVGNLLFHRRQLREGFSRDKA